MVHTFKVNNCLMALPEVIETSAEVLSPQVQVFCVS